MTELRRLWRGELPLDRAFWNYAVIGGIAVNLLTSLFFLVLLSVDWPVAAVAVGYGVSLPYNTVATVGVWRSAGRHRDDDPARATLFRVVTLVGMTVLSVT